MHRSVAAPMLVLLLILVVLSGCLSGTSYPKTFATTYCASMYVCVDEGEIETWLNYDDEADCRTNLQEDIEGSAAYDAFEEGDRTFDVDAANACLEEASQVRDDADCTGSMNILQFGLDAATEECEDVYPPAE